MTDLDRTHRDPVFKAQPTPTLLLDTDLTIRAVNTAYEEAVQRAADDLLGVPVFEAFPDNPDHAEADGVRNLSASFEAAARRRRPHDMLVQRYDIADQSTGEWAARVWHPLNTPVLEDGRVVGLLHQATDITPEQQGIRRVLADYRDLLDAGEASPETAALVRLTDQVAATLAVQEKLAEEVLSLRQALTSRATIDQAKGIIMADRRCTADEAFALLVELSSHTQVRLADVALAFVYRAQGSTGQQAARSA